MVWESEKVKIRPNDWSSLAYISAFHLSLHLWAKVLTAVLVAQ